MTHHTSPHLPTGDPATPAGSPYPGEGCTQPEGRALPPVPSSSLDTTETSVSNHVETFLSATPASEKGPEFGLWDTSAVRFRHSGWRSIREMVHKSLVRTQQPSSRTSSFCTCGAGSWVQRRPLAVGNGFEYRIKASCCHDRLCTPCAAVRSWKLQLALRHLMTGKRMSFITLTLAGKDEGLAAKIDRLYKGFRALRLHPLWADKVKGGAAFLEVKYSDKAHRWHPHLHIMADADYIDQGELSTVWRTITRDSYIVDIRRVKDEKQAAVYVTKYASKPLNSSFFSSSTLLDEAVVALKGRRLCFAFGDWYGEALDLESESLLDEGEENDIEWENYHPLELCIDAASSADAYWKDVLIKCGAETQWRLSLESGP